MKSENNTMVLLESEFDFDDLFFSRTNKRGVIESGNSVFQRVSKYDWEELLGKPHKVVRHPNMPRGVFYLLWETILAGGTIGAYILNKTKDGGHYWVFALVSPIADGFLSVRLKPSSPLFEEVKARYSQLLSLEKETLPKPEESRTILLENILNLGFYDYRHFMVEALMLELEHRQAHLNAPPLTVLVLLRTTLASGSDLQKKSEDIFTAYQKNLLVPLNLEVQATRMGPEAASIAMVSSQYHQLAKEIQIEVQKFVAAGRTVQKKVQECQFYICCSILQREIHHFFAEESGSTPIHRSYEMEILSTLEHQQIKMAQDSLKDIQNEFREFKRVYDNVKKLVIGLEMVSLSGKIEAAKLSQTTDELTGLLNDLAAFKDALKESLREINIIGKTLLDQTQKMSSSLS